MNWRWFLPNGNRDGKPFLRDSARPAITRVLHCLAGLACGMLICRAGPSSAAEVVLSNEVAGRTPAIVGYNVAHFMPGSNTETWWQYAGVNGARLWSRPDAVEPEDDNAVWGDGVVDEGTFRTRRANLRADPLNHEYINWPVLEANFAGQITGDNLLLIDHALSRLRANNISVVATIHRSTNAYPFAPVGTQRGYEDRWEHWQHFYAQAFHMARHADVHKFQMYNEPDHGNNAAVSQAEYLERLQLAADAMQSAIDDVNRLFGKQLDLEVHAPVNSGGNKVFARPGSDPRDDTVGWGQLVLENRHTDLFGQPASETDIFHTYTYHFYNLTGPQAGAVLASVKADVDQVSGGEPLRFAISEFNVHTAAELSRMTETLDSPSKIHRFGSILANLAQHEPDELYIFKFGQTANFTGGAVKKNGVHYVDNDDAPYNTGGATKGAGVVRLFAKGLQGARARLAGPEVSGEGAGHLQMVAARDDTVRRGYLFSANTSDTDAVAFDLDFTAWDLAPGTHVTVEEVSAGRHGEIVFHGTVPAAGRLPLEQPPASVWLATVPTGGPRQQVVLQATDDAMVKSGSNADVNYGSSENLLVKNEPTNPNARNVSYLKFDLAQVDPLTIDQAILEVTGQDHLSSNGVITHVYGIMDDTWEEESITWNNAPNLAMSLGVVDGIEDNFIEDIGGSVKFLGHLTSTPRKEQLRLDVTDFVRGCGDHLVSLVVAREVRWDGENVDDDLGAMRMASKERDGNGGPQLTLYVYPPELAGDFNDDGVVDVADYEFWRATYGESSDRRADGNGDGRVGPADYTIWRDSLGARVDLPPLDTFATAVPEQTGAALLTLSLLTSAVQRWPSAVGTVVHPCLPSIPTVRGAQKRVSPQVMR